MSAIIPLILVAIVAVPVVIIFSLISLREKVRDLTSRLERLTDRMSRAEAQLAKFTKFGAQEPGAEAKLENVEQAGADALLPAPKAGLADEPEWAWGAPPPVQDELVEPPPQPAAPPPLSTPAPALAFEAGWPTPVEAPHFPESPSATSEPPASPSAAKPALALNWEQFMGVKLFAWIGGFALFLAVAFFIKYSFERNLIPPELRVAAGFVVGIGLLGGGVVMKRRELAVTSQTLCATGVVILYAVTFACRSVYHFQFFGPWPTFLLMTLITAVAFTLAGHLEAMVVAILGLLGGFLTPVLLSTGQDNPAGLFSYIALLDAGLLAVAFRRRWHFLILLSAIGTLLMELAWAGEFFTPEKVFVAMAVFLFFDLLYLAAFAWGERAEQPSEWLSAAAIGLPATTLAFTFYLVNLDALGGRPGVLFSFILAADLCLLALTVLRPSLQPVQVLAGGAAFLLLATWTMNSLTPALLDWALGLYLGFAALHTFFPLTLGRARPEPRGMLWARLFPAVALLLVLIPIFKLDTVPFVVWPAVLLIDVLAVGLAILTASVASISLVLVLTVVATAAWLIRIPARDLTDLPALLAVIGGFAVFFYAIGLWARRGFQGAQERGWASLPVGGALNSVFGDSSAALAAEVPALSAILPFLLLIMAVGRLPLSNPSPVFGLAMFLIVLLIGLALVSKLDVLVPVSLGCVLALQYVWHEQRFSPEAPWAALGWYSAFYAVYTVFPFVFQARLANRNLPWAVAALSGPLHFLLFYRAIHSALPNPYMGLLPAALAVPMVGALLYLERRVPSDSPIRLNLLAWFGGSALFFITLIFPIQFERQWITLGWALEGLALIWLFRQIPHRGLRATGVVLLAVAFARLALNPAVLDYHRNSDLRVFNWYLYAYGIVTLCLMLSARLLAPPRNRVWNQNILPFLYTLGTVLAFLLVNIEIADYFAEGPTLTFQFSGNFARDMSYSIAWALFALILLIAGIWKRITAPRYAALALLSVTLLKLFLHDLSQLGQLYRIGAFLVVAVILIVASFLYQRFVSFEPKSARRPV
jgi:uncharacterized membrane protein